MGKDIKKLEELGEQISKEKEIHEIKRKNWQNSKRSMGIALLSIPLLIGGTAYDTHIGSKIKEKQPIINTYNIARQTLSNLNSKLQILEEQEQPYIPRNLDEELEYLFIPPRQDLEKSIQVVERNIQTMEDTSYAIKDYNDKAGSKGFLYTFLGSLVMIIVGGANHALGNKRGDRELKKVEEKYSS